MPVIEIRRNSDGVIRQNLDPDEWQAVDEYMWADDNYSCDCNRYLFFMRAGGEDEGPLIDDRCGDGGYPTRMVSLGAAGAGRTCGSPPHRQGNHHSVRIQKNY